MSAERPPRATAFADVVERGGGVDVSAQHGGRVLVPRDVGDLALLDAGGGGDRGSRRSQRSG
jgi:hypothetical protein